MEHQSKEVFGSLLEDPDFWSREPAERLSIVDYAADQFVADDMADDELAKWNSNRQQTRLAARLGVDGYVNLATKMKDLPDGSPLPDELRDPELMADLQAASAVPYGQTIVLDPSSEKASPGLQASPSSFTEVEIPAGQDGSLSLRFVPIGSKTALDIITPSGTKRHKFNSFDEVPKSGLEMTRFLEANYAEDFGVGQGILAEAGGQIASAGNAFAQGAVSAMQNIPSMTELAIANTMMDDYGSKFSKEYTIDGNGRVIPMPKELLEQLSNEANLLRDPYYSANSFANSEYGNGISFDDAFKQVHQRHLSSLGDIDVTGKIADNGKFLADANFAVMEQLKNASNPEATEIAERNPFLKEGDKVTAPELLAAHIAVRDGPKAKELYGIYQRHLDVVRSIDEVYGSSVQSTLRNSREGFLQGLGNMQQEVSGVTGQIIPVLPAALLAGPTAGPMMTAVAAAPGLVTGIAGNMAESVGSVFQDNLKSGMNAGEAILNATDAGMASAAASAPIELVGDVAMARLFKNFGQALQEIPPSGQEKMGKFLAQMMDDELGVVRKGMTQQAMEAAVLQAVSEASGEMTRATVADQYKLNPDGFSENLKQSLYEGALASMATLGLGGANSVFNDVTSLITKGLVDNRMQAAGIDAGTLSNLLKLPPEERDQKMREFFDVSQANGESWLPAPRPTISGAPVTGYQADTSTASDAVAPTQQQNEPTQTPDEVSEEASQATSPDFLEPTLTDQGTEIRALRVHGLKPGDIIEMADSNEPIRILGAPLEPDGQFANIVGITPSGQRVELPEQALDQGFEVVTFEESQEKAQLEEQPELELADQPTPEPAPATTTVPVLTPVPAVQVGNVGLTPDTIDFAKSQGIQVGDFIAGPNDTFSFDGSQLTPQRNTTISIKPNEEAEAAQGPAPISITRNYPSAARNAYTWAESKGYAPRPASPLGDFMANTGIDPLSIVAEADWQAMGEYVNNLPVVITDNPIGNLSGANIRIDKGNEVSDAIMIPASKWEAKSQQEKASLLIHEVLHSSIGDWAMLSSSPMATAEMKATAAEVESLGKSLYTGISSASTPATQALRTVFGSVFESPSYNPNNPHDLIEELMVRGLTDDTARAALQMVDANLNPIEQSNELKESLWDRIVALFRRMVGRDGTRPEMESLMDRFMALHAEMNAQRAPFMLAPSYSTEEAARKAGLDMGLTGDDFSITTSGASFKMMIDRTGMSQIREAQKELDDAISRVWTEEQGETAQDQLDARNQRIIAAQNKLSDLSEVFFGGLAQPSAANVSLSDDQVAEITESAYQKAVERRETVTANRFILGGREPNSISERLTNAGAAQQAYNRFAVGRGVSIWAAGIRTFPAWQKAMQNIVPTASLTGIWNNIEQSVGEAIQAIGANGTNAFRPQEDNPTSNARRQQYNQALSNPSPENLQPFFNEASQFARTKLSSRSRSSLFTYGPLGSPRNRFISVTKNENGFSSIQFNDDLYQQEKEGALSNPERFSERLVELDNLPNVFREAKERIAGTRVAKAKIRSIFEDAASRMGIDKAGASIIWSQLRLSGTVTGTDMSQALDAALDRAVSQYGRSGVDPESARAKLKPLIKQARQAFYKTHKRSPESILDDSKAGDIAQEAKAKARYLGRSHGKALASEFLGNGTLANNSDASFILPIFRHLVNGQPIQLENRPGFTSDQLGELLGQSLDATYLYHFVNGARSALFAQTVADANYGMEPLAQFSDLWNGAALADEDPILIGGVDFNGKDIFTGLLRPMFLDLMDAARWETDKAAMSLGINPIGPGRDQAVQRIGQMKSAYDLILKGEKGNEAEAARAKLMDELVTTSPQFTASFDLRWLDHLSASTTQNLSDVGNVPMSAPARYASLLKDIQDLRGGLQTNLTDAQYAEFSNARFGRPLETRDERRNAFYEAVDSQSGLEAWKLKSKQTEAIFLLANNDLSRALELGRQLVINGVNPRGFASSEEVSSQIEQMLTNEAANETAAAALRAKGVDDVLPRIVSMLPISPQKAQLGLMDGRAEMVNMNDIIDQLASTNGDVMGQTIGSFLRGNTRAIPTLLIDTSSMNQESAQAFKESDLLSNRTSKLIPTDVEADGFKGDFLVVDVSSLANQKDSVGRLVSEAIRDQFKSGDLKNAQPFIESLSESSVILDHALTQLNQAETKDARNEMLVAELEKVSNKYGGFEAAGPLPLAIEILSNGDFRQAVAAIDPALLSLPSPVRHHRQIEEIAKLVSDADYNESQRKFSDAGMSYDQMVDYQQDAFAQDEVEDGWNIADAFGDLPTDLLIADNSNLTLGEVLTQNAMQVLWSASNYSPMDGFKGQANNYIDTQLSDTGPAADAVVAIAEAQMTTENGELTQRAVDEYANQIGMVGSVIRSVKSRAGNGYQEWLNRSLEEELTPGSEASSLPGASAEDVAQSFKIKASIDPTNPLAQRVYDATVANQAARRSSANFFAQQYWDGAFSHAEYQAIARDLANRSYANQWIKSNTVRELADLAEFMMRPNVGKSVKAGIHSAIAKAFNTDPGEKPESLRKLRFEILHDQWRKIVGKDMAIQFLTGTKFNPVAFDDGFNSLKRFAHNDAAYRVWGARSPETMNQILDVMGVMDFGVTGNQGHTGFRSKMLEWEKRFNDFTEPLVKEGARRGLVRATLVGHLTQFNLDADPAENTAKMVDELEKGYYNLLNNGKNSRGVYKLRKVFRQEMDQFLPLAREFSAGLRTKNDYVAAMNSLLSPVEANWLRETRRMFDEIRPAMEVASRILGRDMGLVEGYLPLLNGKINPDGVSMDNLFRKPGEKVGTSRAGSMNKRFVEGGKDSDYILDLDGSKMLSKFRRDMYTLETVQGGMLLHELLGTRDADGSEYAGQITWEANKRLSNAEWSEMRPTVLGLRGIYDRTRSGFQSGLNIDNRVRRVLTTAQQIGAYKSLADLEQIPKQTIPGASAYALRVAGSLATGDTNHIKALTEVMASLAPGKADLRANMTDLLTTLAPAIYLRGFDGNEAFNEKLDLELTDTVKGLSDIRGMLDQVPARTIGAARTGSRVALNWTVGKPDALLTRRMFLTEYARQGYAAGFTSLDQIFDKANWNPRWSTIAKGKVEELMGSSEIAERGTVMQQKGASVSSEALATMVRAYGIHNISLAAHARALGNEFQYGDAKQKAVAVSKMLEIGFQQALFNALSKPLRDLVLSAILSKLTGEEQEDIYHYLLNDWPLDRKTKPLESGYDYFQTRGWKTLFDMTPMLGAYGAALSLPIVNDIVREVMTEGYKEYGLKTALASAFGEKYKPWHKGTADSLVNATGYLGVTMESVAEGSEAGYKTGEWGKVALSLIAPRGIAGRINQELAGEMKQSNSKPKSSFSDTW